MISLQRSTMIMIMLMIFSLDISAQTVLVPENATWKYLDNGSNQGTAWKETAFVDTSWASGQAGMGERPVTPFHVLFAVTERGKTARAHWGMQEITASEDREPTKPIRTSRRRT